MVISTILFPVKLPLLRLYNFYILKRIGLLCMENRAGVLIVEDNYVSQRMLKIMLDVKGIIADVANDGKEAVEKCRKTSYKLILMDINMPNMDGVEATRIILRESTGEKPAIVAITAMDSSEVEKECFAAGMVGFVAKPYHSVSIHRLLEKWYNSGK